MSVPFIPPHAVPAPLPPVTPPLLPDVNAPHATSDASTYSDKQLRDLEMGKNFPGLWRLAKAQSAQVKEDLRKRAAASLANEPQMVQHSRESPDKREWVDCGLTLHDSRAQGLARAVQGTQGTQGSGWPPAGCGDRYFSEYKELMESFAPLSYQLVGGGDPNTTCIARLPEFIICSDEYLSSTFYDPFDWPKQILDYRNITELWEESPSKGSCAMWWKIECPEPATTQDDINQQIDEALRSEAGTRTYLNQTQLNAYLDWRKANGTAGDFKYILVGDKPAQASPAPGGAVPANSGSAPDGNGSVLGIFASITTALLAIGGAGAIYLHRRSAQGAAPSVTTAVPSATSGVASGPSGAGLQATSPSSMASVSATVSHAGPAPQPAAASTASMAANTPSSGSSDSDDASGIGMPAHFHDLPPAGQEDESQ